MGAFWFQILPVVAFLILGFSIGTIVERAHFRRLARREKALSDMLLTDTKSIPEGCVPESCGLVIGDVVVAADYFKTFVAGIRKMIGGELRTYETLLERARREAIVRMMESARAMGANRVINVRLSTSTVGSSQRRRQAAMVEIYAYGTAICVPDDSSR